MSTNIAAVLPLPNRHTSKTGRQIVLVDIENVVRGAVETQEDATSARTQIERVLGLNSDAHVVIGMSHIGLIDTAMAWPSKQYVVKSGPDGADLALLAEIESLRIERYDEIVLVSGDGIFADAVSAMGKRGATVTVLAHRDGCSARLRMAAARTLFFSPDFDPIVSASEVA